MALKVIGYDRDGVWCAVNPAGFAAVFGVERAACRQNMRGIVDQLQARHLGYA